jgi:hypothetical protein
VAASPCWQRRTSTAEGREGWRMLASVGEAATPTGRKTEEGRRRGKEAELSLPFSRRLERLAKQERSWEGHARRSFARRSWARSGLAGACSGLTVATADEIRSVRGAVRAGARLLGRGFSASSFQKYMI